jgi:hypothetical protein
MKNFLFCFFVAVLGFSQGQAQDYYVSSLAKPGAAIFSAGQDQNGVISLPHWECKYILEVTTNQQNVIVSTDADWCEASFEGNSLTLKVKANEGDDIRTALLIVYSKDFHPLNIKIQQDFKDNSYSSSSNNYIRTFEERAKGKPLSYVLKEKGKLNAIKKAYQLTEFKFVPVGVIEINNGYDPYLPNVEYKGMLYSSTKEIGTSVPDAIPFYTFVTALRNPRSKLYTEHINEPPYHGTNCRAYYGTVCSSLVSYALKLNYGSQDFVDSDLMEDIGYKVPEDVEVGDVLWVKSHVAIITDVLRDENGLVQMVEICEAIHTGSRRLQYNRNKFDSTIMHNRFEKIVRYKYIENNTEYKACPEIVPILDEIHAPIEYNDNLCVDKGDRSNYLLGEDVTINIFSPYDSVVVYKDNERYSCFTKGDEHGDITMSNLPYGSYSASLWFNKIQTKETFWIVVDYDVSYSKEEQLITFSSKNATPTHVNLCAQSGGRGLSYNKILSRYITEEERTTGRLTVPEDKYYDDNHSCVQMKFETKFGSVSTRPLMPNE